jgi:hypothetical protein
MNIPFLGLRIQDQIAAKLFRNSLFFKQKTKGLAMESMAEIKAVLRLKTRWA